MNKVSVQGDPLWAKTAENIAGLFNPEAEAKGATMLSTARYNNARAAGQEDQNNALADTVLAAAGYTPMQIAGIRATRPSGYNDISQGVTRDAGRAAITGGKYREGIALTDPGAWKNFAEGDTNIAAVTDPVTGQIDPGLAAVFSQGVKNQGGNTYVWDPANKTFKVLDVNPQGKNYLAGAQGKELVAGANVDLLGKKGAAVDAGVARADTESEAEIKRKDAEGVAKVNTQLALQDWYAGKVANERDLTAKRVWYIDNKANNDNVKAVADIANNKTDNVKALQAQAMLKDSVRNMYRDDYAAALGKNDWQKVDPAQLKSLTDRAMEYLLKGNTTLGAAMRRSEEDHGITGKTVPGTTKRTFFADKPDGTITFEGFKAPSALADAVAGGSGPAGTTPPAITPTPAPAPAAAPGTAGNPIKITTKEERDALAPGTVYVAPDGSVRTKE